MCNVFKRFTNCITLCCWTLLWQCKTISLLLYCLLHHFNVPFASEGTDYEHDYYHHSAGYSWPEFTQWTWNWLLLLRILLPGDGSKECWSPTVSAQRGATDIPRAQHCYCYWCRIPLLWLIASSSLSLSPSTYTVVAVCIMTTVSGGNSNTTRPEAASDSDDRHDVRTSYWPDRQTDRHRGEGPCEYVRILSISIPVRTQTVDKSATQYVTRYYFVPGSDARYCRQRICVSVCLFAIRINHVARSGADLKGRQERCPTPPRDGCWP